MELTFGIVGLLFLFADVRTFSSTFQQTFFGAPTTQQAIMATAVFLTSFLALVVAWRLGPRRALGASGALFVAATFLCTTSRNNAIDLVLSVIALAGGFWWLAFFHTSRTPDGTSPLAKAFPLALAADLALRATFRTEAVVDLPWGVAVGIVLVGALVFTAAGLIVIGVPRQWMTPGPRGLVGLDKVVEDGLGPLRPVVCQEGAGLLDRGGLGGGCGSGGRGPGAGGGEGVGGLGVGRESRDGRGQQEQGEPAA